MSHVIDSFPVVACQNIRIPRCKLLTAKAYRRRSASKGQWFYGFKVQVIATGEGVPVEFHIHAGSEADMRAMPWICSPGACSIYTTPTRIAR